MLILYRPKAQVYFMWIFSIADMLEGDLVQL